MNSTAFSLLANSSCLLFYGAKLSGENKVDVGGSPATVPENLLMAW
jgi:hypothetical protein